MNQQRLQEQILELMSGSGYEPLRVTEIAGELRLRGQARKRLRAVLNHMVAVEDIVRGAGKTYALPRAAGSDRVTGRVDMLPSGNAFIVTEAEAVDVFVGREHLGTALPGDEVEVRLLSGRSESPEGPPAGRVVDIVSRGRVAIVGTLIRRGRGHFVQPLDAGFAHEVRVADPEGGNAGDRVVLELEDWDDPREVPEGRIIEVIGPADDPSLDTRAVMRNAGLESQFPPAVLREAEKAPGRIGEREGRRDFRQPFVFTIDPETARDFDDALSLGVDEEGNRILGVHIADVAHFVPAGSALDREAELRGNSTYFVDTVVPMLPEQLSNGLCSLRPDADRLAFSAFVTVGAKARVLGVEFARTIIRSKLRLTYEQALTILTGDPGRLDDPPTADEVATIRAVGRLAQQLRRRRFARDGLDLDVPECEAVVGADGHIKAFQLVSNDPAHQLIEECMLVANEAVDRELTGRQCPLLHRVHEPPNEAKLDALRLAVGRLGHRTGDLAQRAQLAEFLRSIADDPLADELKVMALKSMKRARYSHEALGHYGLNKRLYAHFTSPIRRYPDLVVHRILAAVLAGERSPYSLARLQRLGDHCSATERHSDDAAATLLDIKKYRYLEAELASGDLRDYAAVVVDVRRFGFFVDIRDLRIRALVHGGTLPGRAPRFDVAAQALLWANKCIKVGGRVAVHLVKVDFTARQIDVALSDPEALPDYVPTPGRRSSRATERKPGRPAGRKPQRSADRKPARRRKR